MIMIRLSDINFNDQGEEGAVVLANALAQLVHEVEQFSFVTEIVKNNSITYYFLYWWDKIHFIFFKILQGGGQPQSQHKTSGHQAFRITSHAV